MWSNTVIIPQSLPAYPGGKSSMAALVQVVLMVRTGNCGCRFFHRYGEATNAADPSAELDISETCEKRPNIVDSYHTCNGCLKKTTLLQKYIVCASASVHTGVWILTISSCISPEKQSREADEDLGCFYTVHTQVVSAFHFWTLAKTHTHTLEHKLLRCSL